MGEVSYLKLKLADMEGKQGHGGERQHKAEVWLLTKLNRKIHQISPDIYTPIKCTFLSQHFVIFSWIIYTQKQKAAILSTTKS